MAIGYLTGINLNGNELQNAQIHVCAGPDGYPEHPVDGQIVYDSNAQLLKVYKVSGNSGSWSPVGKSLEPGKSIDIANDTVDVDLGGAGENQLLTVDSNGEIAPATITINGTSIANGSTISLNGENLWLTSDEIVTIHQAISSAVSTFDDHYESANNPHSVTASQLLDGDLGAGVKMAVSPAQSSNDTSIATTEYVTQKFGSVDALQYKGTIDGGSTGSYGALTVAANKGDVYKVSTEGKIDGVSVEVGDMLICNADNTPAATTEFGDTNYATVASKWDFIQRNIDGAVTGPASSTADHVATFSDATGKVVKDSGFTIGTSVPSGAVFTDTVVQTSSTTIAADAASPHSSTVTFSGTYLSSYAKDSSGNIVMVETQVITSSGTTTVTFKCAQAPGTTLTCVAVYI